VLAQVFLQPLRRLSQQVAGVEASSLGTRLETAGLDPELGRLAQAFNGMLGRLAGAFDAQRAFVGRASHALRTPLASILSQAEVALLRERSPEAYQAALMAIAEAARGSAQLADGLLALTRADAADHGARDAVSVSDLALELGRLFTPRAEAAGLRFSAEAPDGLSVRATRQRLREMLDALLDNALRYTPRGGAVRFEARAEGAAVVLEVTDTGLGIEAHEQAQVFERFFRGSAAAKSGQPGSGLGLSLVKALSEADGATLVVERQHGGGTRARLRYPS
jgi:signal transduction histidine kinase